MVGESHCVRGIDRSDRAAIAPSIDPYGYLDTGCSIATFKNTPDNTIQLFITNRQVVDGRLFSPGSIVTDMNITINPFQQLYFSDDTQSENNFVELFSDEVLQTAIHPVFRVGMWF